MLGLACIALATTALPAQGFYVSSDRFGYSGTIERYTTLADALAGTNAVFGSPFTVPARDLGLYIVGGNPLFGGAEWANAALFLSAWYQNGGNTPSNQNTGFIQMYDTEGGSVTSRSGRWLDAAMTTYGFSLTGGNTLYGGCADGSGDCGRLWNAGSTLGSATTTAGEFYSYAVNFTAFGLTPAAWDASTLVYLSVSEPTSVSGSLFGIFHNTNPVDLASNGWYKYNLTMNMDNWAYSNFLETQNSEFYASPSYFGATDVVPEPASMILLGTGIIGLFGVGVLRRRRHG